MHIHNFPRFSVSAFSSPREGLLVVERFAADPDTAIKLRTNNFRNYNFLGKELIFARRFVICIIILMGIEHCSLGYEPRLLLTTCGKELV